MNIIGIFLNAIQICKVISNLTLLLAFLIKFYCKSVKISVYKFGNKNEIKMFTNPAFSLLGK